MNKHYLQWLILSLLSFVDIPDIDACGYAWISDCSSQVHLRINGTLDSFNIANCPSNYYFDGLQLGSLQSLSLANAKAITWESCQNNVSAVQFRYRVFEQGFPGGNWQSFNLGEEHHTIDGPYTTRYRSQAVDISLTSGLVAGKTYIVEVYLVAEIDTIGDDFIPETTLIRNNNGSNYKLIFTYGGPSAPPILLLPHLTAPSCHGGNDGNIAVRAYGAIAGAFYQWSNINLNFYQQFGMSAGTYAITVTNGAGQVGIDTMQLGQPALLQTNFTNIQSVGCNGSPGTATVSPVGGTAPYQVLWSNGQQVPTAILPFSASWGVTLTDAHLCTATGTVFIGNTGQVERTLSADICHGEVLNMGNQQFSAPGVYTFTLPGIGGCDTIVHLTVNVLDPASVLVGLPDAILVTCANPAINLCANATGNMTFQWWKDGVPATTTSCLLATAGGVYSVQTSVTGINKVCSATKTILSEEHLIVQPVEIGGLFRLTCESTIAPGWAIAYTSAVNPEFSWVKDGNEISTDDSCFVTITEWPNWPFGSPVLPNLTVTDQYGCRNTTPEINILLLQTPVTAFDLSATMASGATAADGAVKIDFLDGQGPFEFLWNNGATTPGLLNVPPGTYCLTVTDGNGCTSSACAEVSYQTAIRNLPDRQLAVFPNPASAGADIEMLVPENLLGEPMYVEFVDLGGKTLRVEKLTRVSKPSTVAVKIPVQLIPGTCMLRLMVGGQVYSSKILIR